MTGWLRRARGAIGMGVTWAIGWAVAGILIGVSSILLPFLPWNAFFRVFDAPLPALALPGFIAGIFFSFVLGVAGRRRRFSELSLPVFAAWGAVGGLMVSLVPGTMAAVGLATLAVPALPLTIAIAIPSVILGAASAAVTLALARRAQHVADDVIIEGLPAGDPAAESVGPRQRTR